MKLASLVFPLSLLVFVAQAAKQKDPLLSPFLDKENDPGNVPAAPPSGGHRPVNGPPEEKSISSDSMKAVLARLSSSGREYYHSTIETLPRNQGAVMIRSPAMPLKTMDSKRAAALYAQQTKGALEWVTSSPQHVLPQGNSPEYSALVFLGTPECQKLVDGLIRNHGATDIISIALTRDYLGRREINAFYRTNQGAMQNKQLNKH